MSKKHLLKTALALLLCLLCLPVAACAKAEQPGGEEDNGAVAVPVEEPSANLAALAPKDYLRANFDNFNIDGSTSMIPLHQSLHDLFARPSQRRYISHSKTVDSFERFIAGENDLLLGVDYSDELLAKARQNGVELVKRAITKEAFVFLINSNNPVKSLTVEQIKGIYSGEITNWRELGGDDAPIKAYQRNSDSGSQIRMEKFMGDAKLLEQPGTEYMLMGMGDVVEVMRDYDQGKYSIAYNMYTFTEKQYTSDQVILLAVNGVQPDDQAIFDETYPLVIYNYLYYDKNNAPASEFAENLYLYLMSGEGQALISAAGYVNLNEKYDRNMSAESPYPQELSAYEFEIITDLGWYDEEKGEFYDVDEAGNLLVFDNYADYELHGTAYSGHARAREILEIIFAVNMRPEFLYVDVYCNAAEGTIALTPWWDASLDPDDFFNLKFNGRYYYSLTYHINEDKYTLQAARQDWRDSLSGYFDDYSQGYLDNIDFDSTLEITQAELAELYFQSQADTSEAGLREYEFITLFE